MQFNSALLNTQEYALTALQRTYQSLRASGREIINLTIGDPLEPTYPPVRSAVIHSLETHSSFPYPPVAGSLPHLEAVAAWAKEVYGIALDPQRHILACSGTKEAVFHAPLLLDWTNGKEVFIPSLSYPVYALAAGMLHIPFRYLPMKEENGFLPDLNRLSDKDWQRCQLFWINSPHNPTSAIANRAYLEHLLSLAETYQFLVCSDECYQELYYGEQPVSFLELTPSNHWIVFRSLSKRSHMTGFRAGAMISYNEDLIRLMAKMRAPIGLGSPVFVQAGAIAAWQDQAHPQEHTKGYLQKRNLLMSALKAKGFHVFGGDATFYLWFSHPRVPTSAALYELFLKYDLLLTPGTAFGPDGEGYIRLSYCDTLAVCQRVAACIHQMDF